MMKRGTVVLALALSFAFGLGSTAFAQHDHGDHGHGGHGHGDHGHGDHGHGDHAKGAEVLCPVMGEPVSLAMSTPTDDGPVFVCCKGCVKKFNANPDKYSSKVADQRKALANRVRMQVVCPVSGEPVNKDVFTASAGGTVHFCCKDCAAAYTANPAKYKSKLANAYTYQTKCPVMGEAINPKSFTKLATGETVYYCCKGCDKKFRGDLAKYAPKLAAQGIHLNVEKLIKAAAGG